MLLDQWTGEGFGPAVGSIYFPPDLGHSTP